MSYKLLLAGVAALGLLAAGTALWKREPSAPGVAVAPSLPSAQASAAAAGGARPGPGPSSAPLAVSVVVVQPEPLEVQVPATGTLLGRESVVLVSELSRRLIRVHAAEGKRVRKGDVLFELDAADLRAQLGKLEVQARLAQATLERTQKLLGEGLSNQQELDLARAHADELGAEKQVLEVTLEKTRIRAPFAGTLGLRRVSEGAWVSPSTVLATLQDTSALKLDFTLPERYAPSVRPGEAFRFSVEGQPESFAGKIAAVEPAVDAATRSLLVRGVVDGGVALIPGSAASVELPLRVERALLVPAIAIVPGVEGRRVYVAEQGRAKSVAVEVGYRTSDRAQLLSGVKEGDQVIVTNLLRLRDGVPVAVSTEAAAL
jgi:membrane fusion protein (multidrug efflux system)